MKVSPSSYWTEFRPKANFVFTLMVSDVPLFGIWLSRHFVFVVVFDHRRHRRRGVGWSGARIFGCRGMRRGARRHDREESPMTHDSS